LAASVTEISPAGVERVPLGAEVVLDVARAALVRRNDRVDRPLSLELPQDRVVPEAEVVGENVEPPAVSHSHHDLAVTAVGLAADRLVQDRHEHIRAFDREALLAGKGAMKELLERLDLD
jgi:hypothetical protein